MSMGLHFGREWRGRALMQWWEVIFIGFVLAYVTIYAYSRQASVLLWLRDEQYSTPENTTSNKEEQGVQDLE